MKDLHFYVASHGEKGWLTHVALHDDGRLERLHAYPAACPDFLAVHDRALYALLREPCRAQSGVAAYPILPDGGLGEPEKPVLTRGSIASYVLWYRGSLYATNYIQGTTIRLPDRMVVHTGSSVHPVRQQCAHPHCIVPVPGTDALAVADLGTDRIYFFDADLNLLSTTQMPAGVGPRHLAFTPEGETCFCVNEMASTVSVLNRQGNTLRLLASYSTLPSDFAGESSASAIRLSADGKRLYVSNRGHDSVCVFAVDGERLSPMGWIPSHGSSPREIYLTDAYLICANEGSETLTVFSLAGGLPEAPLDSLAVPCPWCIQPFERLPV